MLRTAVTAVGFLALLACGGGGAGGGGGGPAPTPFVPSGPCDAGFVFDDEDPLHAAQAMGLCDGLLAAAWVLPDGSAPALTGNFHRGHGLLASFGSNNPAEEGSRLLVLSSGTARSAVDPGFLSDFDKGYTHGVPTGFPNAAAGCPAVSTLSHDGIGLHVTLQVPQGVGAFTFRHAFFSRDHPSFLCRDSMDQAGALVTGATGLPAGTNVLLDASSNPMFASATSMQACTGCPLGTDPLVQTGFASNGATGWLTTTPVPVTPGTTVEITFFVYDAKDGIFDASIVLDAFTWVAP